MLFLIGIRHIRYFFFTFCPAIIWTWETSLKDWKILIPGSRTNCYSRKFSAKVSSMLDNPFLVPYLCELNHISVCFIQISTKPPANVLFPSWKSIFFKVIPGVFGRLVSFNITWRILLRRSMFPDYLSVSCDYGLWNFDTQLECTGVLNS